MTASILLPQILEKKVSENSAQLLLQVPEDLLYFNGHFPHTPILAGVVQLHWAVHFAKDIFLMTDLIEDASRLKFNNIIRPGDKITLLLEVSPETQSLSYTYKLEEKIYSSGRFVPLTK